MYNVYGNTRDIETCALFVWFVLVRSWFVHPQSARARSARTRTNQKRLGKTPMDVRSCRMVRVDFIWVWFVSGSFWFVLVRAGSFSLFFDVFSLFFNPLAPARARTRTNQKRTRPKSNPLAPGGIIEHTWLFYPVCAEGRAERTLQYYNNTITARILVYYDKIITILNYNVVTMLVLQ
jgi:hypothetical protein